MKRFFLIVFIFTNILIQADTIYLKDGRKLTGQIEAMTEDIIILVTDFGRIEIKRSSIAGGVFFEDKQNFFQANYKTLLDLNFSNSFSDKSPESNSIQTFGEISFEENQDGASRSAATSSGTGNYIKIIPSTSIVNLNTFTIHLKIKIKDVTKPGYIFSFYADKDNKEGKFSLFQNMGIPTLYVMDKDKAYHTFSVGKKILENEKWATLTMTFDGSTMRIYNNLSEEFSQETKFTQINCPQINFYIFTAYTPNKDNYTSFNIAASIDFFKIFDRALTTEEIISIK
ncbi:MAG: LamG domain-containing protein [Spirochaetales bacterium]|nr:LamG domain-containing protein [Spirochaetales bacterium]